MPRINYLDFDLQIVRADTGYRVLVRSPAGPASLQFTMPFLDMEVENFFLRVGRPRAGMRGGDTAEIQVAKEFGTRLFNALFDDEVLGCLHSSLDEATGQGRGLRIRLSLTEVPELADLPWEYLYYPKVNRFLTLSAKTPLVRYLELSERIRPLAVTPPLRLLAMIASPTDYAPLDVEREWSRLSTALEHLTQRNLVTLERVARPSLAALKQQLRQREYHMFHFIGHGKFDPQRGGMLMLEDEDHHGRAITGQDLGIVLHDHDSLRLAILNACEGARSSRSDPFAGVAQSLVQQGLPVVLAMQFEVSNDAAVALSQEFYSAIADGYPVDAALADARQAIFTQGHSLEWGTPVLYLRAPDGRIFDFGTGRLTQQPDAGARPARSTPPAGIATKQALLGEAQAAIGREHWAVAIEKLKALLVLDPKHADANALLGRAQQQQMLAVLYGTGRRHYEAGRWREALDTLGRLQSLDRDYKDVGMLVEAAQRKLAKPPTPPPAVAAQASPGAGQEPGPTPSGPSHSASVDFGTKAAEYYAAGEAASQRGDWEKAITGYKGALVLAPNYRDAERKLAYCQTQQRCVMLHAQAERQFADREYTPALDTIAQIRKLSPAWPNLANLQVLAECGQIYTQALAELQNGNREAGTRLLQQIVARRKQFLDTARRLEDLARGGDGLLGLPLHVKPGERLYELREADLSQIAEEFRQWFLAKSYQAQVLQQGETFVVQGRKGGTAANLLGLEVAATIILDRTSAGFKASIGSGKWANRAAVAVVGLALLYIPTVTAAVGAGKQKALELSLWQQIEQYVTARGGRRVPGG